MDVIATNIGCRRRT